MTKKTVELTQNKPLFGWCNRLLRIDLSNSRIWAEEISDKVPEYIGGRGLAAKILWDEFPEPVDPFDEKSQNRSSCPMT